MSILRKARIIDTQKKIPEFSVQFNPNSLEYSIGEERHSNKKVKDERTGSDLLQSDATKRANSGRLSVKLFFHTYTNDLVYTDVNEEIAHLRRFYQYTSSSEKSNNPVIVFAWGTFAMEGIITSFKVNYHMFAPDGTPVQAEVSITIKGDDRIANSSVLAAQDQGALGSAAGQDSQLLNDLSWLFQ